MSNANTSNANSSDNAAQAHAIQIISPKNNSFRLNLDELQRISRLAGIEDRSVAIVSIAGAYRKGKSFLLNFFLKYLNAQYKKRDVSDWLDENDENSKLTGFTSRGGRKPETTGIWMWSEIFTHDFENGEKVAIILIDTQGMFDHKNNKRYFTATFALSMMLSSVQCYNVMQNIQEDDLENLGMFTEYGRLALEHSSDKPFQKLIFVVRDWPYAEETGYGWNGQQVMNENLAEDSEQDENMRQLRTRIKSSFEEVTAFLMPHPGMAVANGAFSGFVRQVDPEFKRYVKELVTGLFAPEHLIIKKINGQNVRMKALGEFLQAYVNVFNGNTLPEATSVLKATADVSNAILAQECMNLYKNSMQNALNTTSSYYSDSEFQDIHRKANDEALKKFADKPKLGGDDLAEDFKMKLENEITDNLFDHFQRENNEKRNIFLIKENAGKQAKQYKELFESLSAKKNEMENELWEAKRQALERDASSSHNYSLRSEIKATFESAMMHELGTIHLDDQHLTALFAEQKSIAMRNFDQRKKEIEGNSNANDNRNGLEQDISNSMHLFKRVNRSNYRNGCNIL